MKTTIKCENCGEMTIEIDETRGGNIVKRGFTGRRGKQYYSATTRYLTKNCPKCGSYHGKKIVDRNKVIERLKARGLPLVIKSEK
jgi:ribosomal protein L32